MPIQHGEPAIASLPPFPEGWYFITSRKALLKEGLIQKTWMGEKIVAWSDEDGRACVAEAFCPHLGSDLGPDAGGRVCAGRLVCPFHGFEFDTTGQCVDTPYAPPPRSARLRVFETREIAGLIFGWWGIGGREPQWSLPEETPDQTGWSDVYVQTMRFPGHPQETAENSVDLAHLRYIHGYHSVNRVEPASMDGHHMVSRFDFTSRRKVARVATLTFELSADTDIYGLGYSFVKIREHTIGMDLRMWIMATPVDGTLIDLSLASQVREIRKPRRLFVGLGFLPRRLRAPLINRFMASRQRQDVLDDIVIWSRKKFVSPPRLNRSDGEIMAYRAYCAQFYPDPAADEHSAATHLAPPQEVPRPTAASLRD